MHLVQCEYFKAQRLNLDITLQRSLVEIDSFVVYIVLEGEGSIKFEKGSVTYKKGESILVFAFFEQVILKPVKYSKILEIFISKYWLDLIVIAFVLHYGPVESIYNLMYWVSYYNR
ncbi:hypothetical protein [Flavivirga spongiicola]|uniref:hypothetical protein n=1 Tax=Flavivirga spongiicola TaxID=421621 RepID=UPI0038CC070F